MQVTIYPPEEILEAAVALPLSKSMSNRALIMNALTPGSQPLASVANCDDTSVMQAALYTLQGDVNVGLAGTAMRFLAAYYAATPGADITLDGNDRMRQRPIGPLVDALKACGADIEYAAEAGFPPLRIRGRKLHGGDLSIEASISSQFISALLMVAPTFDSPLTINLIGEISSLPYLKMTIEMMRRRGIEAELYGQQATVRPGSYLAVADQGIEHDWSAASYWYEICAMSAGWVTLLDMSLPSLQGDSAVSKIFERLGVVTEPSEDEPDSLALNPSPEMHSRLDIDLSDNPDLAQTLAVTCCMLGVPFKFTGLKSLKIKETDRLQALQSELAKLSMAVEIEGNDTLSWQMQRIPVQEIVPIDAHGDHRMAMAFAPCAVFISGLKIDGAECVSKSYPEFWDHLRQAGFIVEEN